MMPGQLDLRVTSKPTPIDEKATFLYMMVRGPKYFVALNGKEIQILANGCVYYNRFGERLPAETLVNDILEFIFKEIATPKIHEILCDICGRKFGQFQGVEGDDFGEYYHCAPCMKVVRAEREVEDYDYDY